MARERVCKEPFFVRRGSKIQRKGSGLRRVAGYLLAGTALIACPYHLVVLLPAVLGLFGVTALGAALAANAGWVYAAATAYFAVALTGTLYLLYGRADNGEGNRRTPPPAGGESGERRTKTEARRS